MKCLGIIILAQLVILTFAAEAVSDKSCLKLSYEFANWEYPNQVTDYYVLSNM